jgi:protein O-mannosyl-transferase
MFFYLLTLLAYLRFDPLGRADRAFGAPFAPEGRDVGAMPLPVRGEGHEPPSHAHPRKTACEHGTHGSPCDRAPEPPPRRWGYYGLALFFFLCALLSKTVACTLPAVIFLLTWWKEGKVRWAQIWPLKPMLVMGGALGLLTVWVEKNQVGAEGFAWNLSWMGHVLLAARIVWFYLGKLFWPSPIVFSYPRWIIDPSQAWQYLYPVAAVGLVAALWFLRKRIGRGPLTAVLCFGVGLFPALGFLNVYPMRFSYVADHFQYHACLAIFALATAVGVGAVAEAAAMWARRIAGREVRAGTAAPSAAGVPPRRAQAPFVAGACVVAAIAMALSALTGRQGYDYKDRRTLWASTLQKNPASYIACHNLACIGMDVAIRAKDLDGLDNSTRDFQKAMVVYESVYPGMAYDDALMNMGIICLRKSMIQRERGLSGELEVDQANEYFHQAKAMRPKSANMRNRIGTYLCDAGQLQDALPYYREAIAIDANSADAYFNIGWICLAQGLRPEAKAQFEAAIRVQGDHAEAHFCMGQLLVATDANLALQEYRRVLAIDPKHTRAMEGAVDILSAQGRLPEALQTARQALSLDGNLQLSLGVAAGILAGYEDPNFRDGKLALEYALRLCRITRDADPRSLDVLAGAYAETGNYDQAVQTVQKAIDQATAKGWQTWAEMFRAHQRLYLAKKPFRAPARPKGP